MLGDEARAAADALMRPRAPAWEFLPLRVTVAKANVVTGMKPGDRPELDVKLTLVRRRQPGATKFGSRTPSGSKKSNARTRDEADAARRGPGAYRLRYGQTERRAPRAVIGTSGLGDDAVMEDDEDAYAEGSVLDIDPAAAFAAASSDDFLVQATQTTIFRHTYFHPTPSLTRHSPVSLLCLKMRLHKEETSE